MMRNNFDYSKILLHYCLDRDIPLLYASSAAVYGAGRIFKEQEQYERPLNVYGYSKALFDRYVRRLLPDAHSQVVGLRYFNVYGPREQHKNAQASVAFHCNTQLATSGRIRLFEGSDGYADGEQCRDFLYATDAVAANLWFLEHPEISGIFNLGSGRCQSFNEVAQAVIAWRGRGEIEYIPMPAALAGCYQSFTESDDSALLAAGYEAPFKTVEQGVTEYMQWLNAARPANRG